MPETGAAEQPQAFDPLTPAVLEIVRQTHVDLHRREPAMPIIPATSLDRDLEFDSLARVELVLRLERSFSVHMPDTVLESAETCGDLVSLLRSAGPARIPSTVPKATVAEATAVAVPDSARTLIEVLNWQAQHHPGRVHLRHVEDPLADSEGQSLCYGELRDRASRLAAGVQGLGLQRGQTVAIMLPTGLEYFVAYFGVLLAGCVPVPIYPPLRPSQIEEHVRRHAGILDNAGVALMITVAQARSLAQLLSARVRGLEHVATVAELESAVARYIPVAARAEDVAFIQYTSGSTGSPKGVVLTHANLLANIRAFGSVAGLDSGAIIVSWLPLYHDMGLIGTWLSSLYYGALLIVMSPLAFLARPERWLWAVHRFRGTHTVAPNFAYELCLKRIGDEQIRGLDLSCLRVAANGSEQVQPDTLERFAQRFAAYGLDAHSLLPVYGLAECSVGLLVPPLGRGVRTDRIQRDAFAREGLAIPAMQDDARPLRFVCCGRALPGHEVRVVDAQGTPIGDRIEGRLEFRGPSASSGYHRNPELTRKLIREGWLDSGDRAYRVDGEWYLTGRVKDIIIRGGRNLYPDELEEAVGAVAGVRRGCVVAFGVSDAQRGTERLVVLAETRESDPLQRERLHAAAVGAIVDRLGEPPDELVLVPPKAILKTSSGKLRRAATRECYLAGELGRAPAAARWQLLRLSLAAVPSLLARRLRRIPSAVYPVYVWSWFALLAPISWLLVSLMPRQTWAWAVARVAARLLLRLAGVRLNVQGAELVPRHGPCVIVANHSSYLDGLVLIAALPGRYRFVAKRELLGSSIAGIFLNRLGTEFVERYSVQQGVEDARRLTRAVQAGASLVLFPEGTFVAAPALLPFHLGAFVVAARTQASVVPVVIRGTRTILRAGSWAPRWAPVSVTVSPPIAPPAGSADAFGTAVVLRQQARARILALCGEGDAAPSTSQAGIPEAAPELSDR